RVPKVGVPRVERGPRPDTSGVLSYKGDIAELPQGGEACLHRRHAARDVVLRLHGEVFRNVALQFLFQAAPFHHSATDSTGRMMRAMAPANFCHLPFSMTSCFLPFGVRR